MEKEETLKHQNGTIINGTIAQQSSSIEIAKNCAAEREDCQQHLDEFDIDAVIHNLAKALEDPNSTNLPHYINAFAELKKLFSKLGVVFSFVETDLRNKHTILAQLIGQDPQTYATIEGMIYAECFDGNVPSQNGCTISAEPKQPKAVGSRTLLRLHRSLAFLVRFVELVQKPPSPTESTSNLFRMAYAETLSKHHTWYIRASVQCASAMVPNRAQLIKIMFDINETANAEESNVVFGCNEKQQKIDQIAERFLEMTRMAYDRVEKFYGQHGLLDLP